MLLPIAFISRKSFTYSSGGRGRTSFPIISLRIYGSIFKAQAAACDFRCSFSFSERRTKTAVVLSIKNHLISLPTGGVLGALPLTSGRFDSKMTCLLIQMLTHLPRPPSALYFPPGKPPLHSAFILAGTVFQASAQTLLCCNWCSFLITSSFINFCIKKACHMGRLICVCLFAFFVCSAGILYVVVIIIGDFSTH